MRCIVLLFISLSLPLQGQDYVSLQEIGLLDSLLHETSGLARLYNTNNGNFDLWTHNDFRNKPEFLQNTDSIYRFLPSQLDNVSRILDIGIPSGDWEDITKDKEGNLYLGDFGSANNNDDQIIRVEDPSGYSGNPSSAQTDSIEFEYPVGGGYSDVEAMVHLNGFLYFFTKRVTPNFNPDLEKGTTYMLRIPDEPHANGVHVADSLDEFITRLDPAEDNPYFRVTAAALNPSESVLVLLCQRRLWIFSCFEGDDFFGGHVEYIEFINNQKEGIEFINDHEVFISKEGQLGSGSIPKLFHLDISPWIDDSCLDCQNIQNGQFSEQKFGWIKTTASTASATFDVVNEEAKVNVTSITDTNWHVSLKQKGLVLENGRDYRITFDAYADAARTFPVIMSTATGSQHLFKNFSITTTPATYSHDFTMNDPTDYNAQLNFALGKQLGEAYFDNVSITELNCICPADRTFYAPVSGVHHFEASESIKGLNEIVLTGTDIRYDAGQFIELLPEFAVEQGAAFEAYIDGCDGN